MHGKPVKEDDLIDLYTKRPFGKVFEALRQVQIDLKPVFDAAPEDIVEQPMQQYTPLNKRERIVELKREGKTATQIMGEVGVVPSESLVSVDDFRFDESFSSDSTVSNRPSCPNSVPSDAGKSEADAQRNTRL